MSIRYPTKLNHKKRYLQVALNNTLEDAYQIIVKLPKSDRIIVEAGTPLIKRYGENGIRQIRRWFEGHLTGNILMGTSADQATPNGLLDVFQMMPNASSKPQIAQAQNMPSSRAAINKAPILPYVVADLKTMDRGQTEVEMAARAGASAAVALGNAPIETLDAFIENCQKNSLDAMVDMMNVDYPLSVLRALKKVPPVVILHRGVDEEHFNREKMIPFHEIQRIKGNYDIMIAIAGGDTSREVQRAVFNDADIVVIWKSVFQNTAETIGLVNNFLTDIK